MKLFKTILVGSMLSASVGMADGGKTAPMETPSKTYKRAYGMGGCGLGSVLINEAVENRDARLWQIVAVLINDYFGQTFAISSGTSNCTDAPDVAKMEREVYMHVNLNTLSKEVARGEGEHLQAFAEVLGCTSDNARATFKKVSQENHDRIFTSSDAKTVLQNYVGTLKSSSVLAKKCERLG